MAGAEKAMATAAAAQASAFFMEQSLMFMDRSSCIPRSALFFQELVRAGSRWRRTSGCVQRYWRKIAIDCLNCDFLLLM
jgi:hypothetical protein